MYNVPRQPSVDEEAALGILRHLDKDELQNLLSNESSMDTIISDCQQVKNLTTEKETLMTSNKSVAEYNLLKEPRLDASRRQLATTYENAIEIQKSYVQHKQQLESSCNQQSIDTTLALLQAGTAEVEEESEEMANKLLEGEMDLDEFLTNFIGKRTIMHQRRVRIEKLKEVLQQGQRGPAAPSYPTPSDLPYPGGAAQGGWQQPPYPMAMPSLPAQPYSYAPR